MQMEHLTLNTKLLLYRKELEKELENILKWWIKYTPDEINGGFIGKIDHEQRAYPGAVKGAVLNARILWSFSAGYNLTGEREYLEYATRAYRYIRDHFMDTEFGGVYWTVNAKGEPEDTKKQVYANAFVIYALSEYYQATSLEEAAISAKQLYASLEKHSFDPVNRGYFEAFNRNWTEIADLRLSEKDANEKKTMNTHLHVLEAYTNLYSIWKDGGLRNQIVLLLENFLQYIINPETKHLVLFLDENWEAKSRMISYGHDIEAAWLLLEAAEVIDDYVLTDKFKNLAIDMANAASDGVGHEGEMWYDHDPLLKHTVKEKHWWVQAEAMVGFFNAWQVSTDEQFLHQSMTSWGFVKQYILDKTYGEWIWGIDENGKIMEDEDKAGLWKCPYHNSRACIELIRRISI